MAYNAYVKFDDIDGGSTEKGHEKWASITKHYHESKQPASFTQQAAGRSAEAVEFGEYFFEMPTNPAIPKLQDAHWGGKILKEVTMHCTRSGGSSPVTYLEVKLTNALVSSIVSNGDPTGEYQFPTEKVGLTFEKIEVTFTSQKPTGEAAGKIAAKWHVAQGTAA